MQLTDLVNVRGKLVWVRANMDIPVTHGRVASYDRLRLERNADTVQWLIRHGARVVLLGHRGRPRGRRNANLSLQPLVPVIKRIFPGTSIGWHGNVWYRHGHITTAAETFLDSILPGEVGVLENIRFIPEEKENDREFARSVAQHGDIYVQDAFSVCHRVSASTVGIPRYTQAVMGKGLARELVQLEKYLACPRHPYVAMVGGAKISTKLGLLQHILTQADQVLLGGALANTILQAQGVAIGRSLAEPKVLRTVKKLKLTNKKLHVPLDVVVAEKNSTYHHSRICAVGNVRKRERILDIGPETVALYSTILDNAKTIVWNGPMGFFEDARFAKGTRAIGRAVSTVHATTIIGGGETIAAVGAQRRLQDMTVVSVGGGALLAWLEGKQLPGIRALMKK